MNTISLSLNKLHGTDVEGHFLDESDYDLLIQEDTTVVDADTGETLLIFRKGVLNDTLSSLSEMSAFDFFKKAAKHRQANDNRGFSAGRISSWVNATDRPRLSTGQYNALMRGKGRKGFNSFEEFQECLNSGNDPSPYVWLARAYKEMDWDAFVSRIQGTPVDTWQEQFKEFFTVYVDAQRRANPCFSRVLGAFARTGRNPYCRLSNATLCNAQGYEYFHPLYQEVSRLSEIAFPEKAALVKEGLKGADPFYTLFNTMFTCITVNWQFRTASHFDGRNYGGGFASLTVLGKGDYQGSYLVFPELRVAFDLRQGDILSGDTSSLLHGNTERTGEGERVSLVFFTRQDIANVCHSRSLEEARKDFYHHCKGVGLGKSSRKGWKGGFNGMYDTPEWYTFFEGWQAEHGVSVTLKERDKKNA
jgi:hypothetical protein